MTPPDAATIFALRSDVAHQIARRLSQLGLNQLTAARQLAIPQPTVSKIVNGRVADLSLELLIRIAVRAGIPMTLQTGHVPEEAGAFSSGWSARAPKAQASALNDEARTALARSERALTPTQRLQAFLEHNALIEQLRAAGRTAEVERTRRTTRA
ncbi:MAG: XRE family transcriptional regulator [Proteobacteria bacterium]|nr:XRE family transcriptional regulator [Pseudomonadota bacterium]